MRLRIRVASAVAALAVIGLGSTPATAITDGTPDGDAHPHVGLMVAFREGQPQGRCSGTLMSPTVFLTAGHCTSGADRVEIWFDDDVTDAAVHGYPWRGEASGTPQTHPQYDEAAFHLHDLGVVVLDEAVDAAQYGTLPAENQLDALATSRGRQDVTFTAVGYGVQKSFPSAASWKTQADRIRMVAHPRLNQINTGLTGERSLLLSNNARTGGTCFGDSGGPNFLGSGNVVAGVTSFSINDTCGGNGGVYRIDRAEDLGWLAGFLG